MTISYESFMCLRTVDCFVSYPGKDACGRADSREANKHTRKLRQSGDKFTTA